MTVWKDILLAAACSLLPMAACAQERSAVVGALYSYKELGIGVTMVKGQSEASHMIWLTADMYGVMEGETGLPGMKLTYNMVYPLRTWTSLEGNKLTIAAGPGLSTGLVRDHGSNHYGLIGGLSGVVGLYHVLVSDVVIGISLRGELGLNLSGRDSHDTSIKLYENGVRRALIPELSMCYAF